VNALANEEVGTYLNEHCVSTFLKVGTFQVVNGQKQGGNVASYFCLGNGKVLHVVAGPVDAATLLREARWVVETRKLAVFESRKNMTYYTEFFRRAHMERLKAEHGIDLMGAYLDAARGRAKSTDPAAALRKRAAGSKQAKVHLLLAEYPLIKIEQAYRHVFENVLGEKLSTLPVAGR
jgi:hypothetical protein